MGFETRYGRFAVVQGIPLLNERVLGPLRIRHFLYSLLAVLLLWRGLTSNRTTYHRLYKELLLLIDTFHGREGDP